jgi:hypothetical protein
VICSPKDKGQDVYLRPGNPPTPVPQPLAGLLIELTAARANMNTASNPGSNWLFPGGRAGQPLTPGVLRQRFQALRLRTIRPAPQRSASSPSKHPPQSSRPHSATVAAPPISTGSLQAGPGAATARSPAENTTQVDTARHQ